MQFLKFCSNPQKRKKFFSYFSRKYSISKFENSKFFFRLGDFRCCLKCLSKVNDYANTVSAWSTTTPTRDCVFYDLADIVSAQSTTILAHVCLVNNYFSTCPRSQQLFQHVTVRVVNNYFSTCITCPRRQQLCGCTIFRKISNYIFCCFFTFSKVK